MYVSFFLLFGYSMVSPTALLCFMVICCYFIVKSTEHDDTVHLATIRNRAEFVYIKTRSKRNLSSTPFQCRSSNSSVKLCMILLLAGDIASNPGPENANLKLAYTNIRSIRNKHAAINNYISANNTDILALSETWLSEKDTDSPK